MIFLVNTNEYLGGGESLLVRMAKNLTQDFKVICKSKSFIERELDEYKEKLISIHGPVNYLYLSEKEKNFLIDQISRTISSNSKIITFFMADTILINEVIRKRGIKGCKLLHLYLHPYDYLYGCESIYSKFKRFLLGNSPQYTNYIAKDENRKLLKSLDSSKSLIFMNEANFSAHDIDIKNKCIVPLPIDTAFPDIISDSFNRENQAKKIIWVGRIIDFKIPSIVAMCSFVSKNNDYQFHIYGKGEQKKIKKLFPDDINNKIFFHEEIPYKELYKKIKEHDIGYAMGTTAVEMAACNIPTIVALASPDFKKFKQNICAGFLSELDLGNIGDELYGSLEFVPRSIDQCINEINASRSQISKREKTFIEENFGINNIQDYLMRLSMVDSFEGVEYKWKPSWLRILLSKFKEYL